MHQSDSIIIKWLDNCMHRQGVQVFLIKCWVSEFYLAFGFHCKNVQMFHAKKHQWGYSCRSLHVVQWPTPAWSHTSVWVDNANKDYSEQNNHAQHLCFHTSHQIRFVHNPWQIHGDGKIRLSVLIFRFSAELHSLRGQPMIGVECLCLSVCTYMKSWLPRSTTSNVHWASDVNIYPYI